VLRLNPTSFHRIGALNYLLPLPTGDQHTVPMSYHGELILFPSFTFLAGGTLTTHRRISLDKKKIRDECPTLSRDRDGQFVERLMGKNSTDHYTLKKGSVTFVSGQWVVHCTLKVQQTEPMEAATTSKDGGPAPRGRPTITT
jgi:hypothetical protein